MALIAVVTAKGSPGASTAALAAASTWPSPVLLVEADPAGADSPTGLLQGTVPADHGVLGLAMSARAEAGLTPQSLFAQSVALGGDERRLLPGLQNPAQAGGVASLWSELAGQFLALEGVDVLADCGRLGASYAPEALWQAADLVVLVLRPLIGPVHSARLWLRALAERSADTGIAASQRLALLVVDDPAASLSVKQVIEQTSLPGQPHLTVLGTLPVDLGAAAVLAGRARWTPRFERGQYMRAASTIARNAAAVAATNRAGRAVARQPVPVQNLASGGGYVY